METISSSERDKTAEIDRCLSMIVPSASDESKFVGMLILPKLLDQNKPQDIERVFQGMNFKFIERLLRTNQTADAQIPDPVLKEIAVNVLSCFAHYDNLAIKQDMADRIPALSRLLIPHDTLSKDILDLLIHIAIKKEGLVRMLDPDVLKNVFHVLLNTDEQQEREKCTALIVSVYRHSSECLANQKIPSLYSATKYSLGTLISIMTDTLDQDQKQLKFEALHILSAVLPHMSTEMMQQVKKEQANKLDGWLDTCLHGLRQLLTSKLRDEQRDQAFTLIACLLRHFGHHWLFKSLQDTKLARRKKEKATTDHSPAHQQFAIAHFPALLIHLVSIETKVMLDDINDRLNRELNEEKTIVNKTRQARQEAMIPMYFEILEAALEYLSFHYESTGMDADMLLKLRNTLSDVMDVVMELLKFMQDTRDDLEQDMIAQACIRLVSIWMAEEGYEMPE
ncbi:hypothetical protein CU098_008382 [Rhizopus stolonifer]|uniref:Neurochondrin n=1 Tax=Rhizopus stolonifer TaxID=4846 RepID=A0A367JQ36_RHIST|nr:hypothetical protein CU098_008382 [Rhizopus stolonifer]